MNKEREALEKIVLCCDNQNESHEIIWRIATEALNSQDRMYSEEEVRPTVKWFSMQMEAKLKLNDYKGGWDKCEFEWLLKRMKQEIKELQNIFDQREMHKGERSVGEGICIYDLSDEAIVQECADIANFAMMIADRFKF